MDTGARGGVEINMASGRRSAGERVLEGKHVIGLFLLMLLFSGVFFTLGYVMGRNYSGQVSAENRMPGVGEPHFLPSTHKSESSAKKSQETPTTEPASEESPVTNPDAPIKGNAWGNAELGSSKTEPAPLEPAPKATPVLPATPLKVASPKAKAEAPAVAPKTGKGASAAPLIPNGSYLLQVAALSKQDDALEVAGSLQKKHFAAYVQPPQKDKYYRVQVGPFKDQKSADTAKKGLEGAGYKAFYVKH